MSHRGLTLKSRPQGLEVFARLDHCKPQPLRGTLLERCLRGLGSQDTPSGSDRSSTRSPTILQLSAVPTVSVAAGTRVKETGANRLVDRADEFQSVTPVSARGREFLRGLNEILETVQPEFGQVEEVDFAATNS